MWLVHTTSKKKSWVPFSTTESNALRNDLVMWCCTNPGYWSHCLGVHLIKAGGPAFADMWEELLEESRLGEGYVGHAAAEDAGAEKASSPESEIVEDAGHRSKDVSSGRHRGWRRAAAAPSLPIGVVR